ncbi:DUF6702 family protein [Hellea balneolensis]|uniref:DUF6702 family protein n=1 Tax=Hellea balneolensis TaxID=287478 RepID=UPI00047CB01A|nr:DUF6702 family protein [Hellea balneolensis]
MFTRRNISQILSGAAIMAGLPFSASAHREKKTLTTIEWDADEKMLNVIHSYHLHDAETALAAAGIIDRPDLFSLKARAQLALYTEKHFSLLSAGAPIDLEILGAETEAKTVYVYQQAKMKTVPTELLVSASMLRDIIPGQLNNVDVKLSGAVRSIQFKKNDGPKKVLA